MGSLLVGDEQLCLECGMSHLPERRQAALKRLLPAEKETIQSVFPCWWAGVTGSSGSRRLLSDLKAVGARFDVVTKKGSITDIVWFPSEYSIV